MQLQRHARRASFRNRVPYKPLGCERKVMEGTEPFVEEPAPTRDASTREHVDIHYEQMRVLLNDVVRAIDCSSTSSDRDVFIDARNRLLRRLEALARL
ncbi:hypothetical protein SAMN07250955_105274 [Arboricoccus pini]|uniref:Uncharacterized protein n=1 Tax=Arboricoccus pini TaxID=1963835 RepID=A0A212R570_9PROT|nr:hypothetical protein SAMN07250955_105274 [Arboricoccus pini]